MALAGYTARADEAQGFVDGCLFRACFKDDLCVGNDVGRKSAAANGILCDEFKQRRIAEIINAFESDALTSQMRMLIEVRLQTCYIPCIEKIDGTAKEGVLDSLMAWQVQSIGWSWFFHVGFQTRPAWKAMFARDG